MRVLQKKSTFTVALILGMMTILLGYQNCGKVKFSENEPQISDITPQCIQDSPQIISSTTVQPDGSTQVSFSISPYSGNGVQWTFINETTGAVLTSSDVSPVEDFQKPAAGTKVTYSAKAVFSQSKGVCAQTTLVSSVTLDGGVVPPTCGAPTLNGPATGVVGQKMSFWLSNVDADCFPSSTLTDWKSVGANIVGQISAGYAQMPSPTAPAQMSYSAPGTYTMAVWNNDQSTEKFNLSAKVVIGCPSGQKLSADGKSCVAIICTNPFTGNQIDPGEFVYSYPTAKGTCTQQCIQVKSTCTSTGNFDIPVAANATCTNPPAVTCGPACTLKFSDNTTATLASGSIYPSLVYGSGQGPAPVPPATVGGACHGFQVECINGVINNITDNVVAPSPLYKACCSQQELNQSLQAMIIPVNTTNANVSAQCSDPSFDSVYTNCTTSVPASFTAAEESFLSVTYTGYCKKMTTSPYYSVGGQSRYLNTCANRYCNHLPQNYFAGFMIGGYMPIGIDVTGGAASIANTDPTSVDKSHLNEAVTAYCMAQVPPPTVSNACQAIINYQPIGVLYGSDYYSVGTNNIVKDCNGRLYDGTTEYTVTCGTAYCKTKDPGFVLGRVTEFLTSNALPAQVQCFRNSTSYNGLFH